MMDEQKIWIKGNGESWDSIRPDTTTNNELRRESLQVQRAAEVYGGSFFQAIGRALCVADIENTQKIKDTWHTEWQKYLYMAQQIDRVLIGD